MKFKLISLAAVFAAGMTASFAFAHDGPGKGDEHGKGHDKARCTEVHLRGTIAAQALNVTVDGASRKLDLAPGTAVQLQLGAAGQTVRINAEACRVVTGTSTVLQVKSAEIKVKTPKQTTTTTNAAQTTTTAPTTTSG